MYIISAVLEKGQSKVALYDKEYKLIKKKDGSAADLSKLCLEVISDGGITPADVQYIGIAVDNNDAVAADLEKEIGVKCFKESFMNARALGEAYMSNDAPYLLILKIDDTIDCGIVIDKKAFSGSQQLGGKIAHMAINFGGYECTCGRKGCFEAYSNNSGLKRIAAEAGVENAESITHKKLFAMNTPSAELAKKLYVKYLACGITNVINLFQPNELILEGPFTEVGDELMKPMMDIVLQEQYSRSMPNKCNIRSANSDADTALIGAAMLGR